MIDMYGFSKIWSAQNAINVKYISAVVKQRLQDEWSKYDIIFIKVQEVTYIKF